MKNWKNIIAIIVVGIFISMGMANSAKAEPSLKIVFVNSVWGAAVGVVAGAATWALQNKPVDDIPLYMVRGAAVGVFVGMGYGFYIAHQDRALFGKNKHQQGILHFDSHLQTLYVSPGQLLPQVQLSPVRKTYKTTLLSASF